VLCRVSHPLVQIKREYVARDEQCASYTSSERKYREKSWVKGSEHQGKDI